MVGTAQVAPLPTLRSPGRACVAARKTHVFALPTVSKQGDAKVSLRATHQEADFGDVLEIRDRNARRRPALRRRSSGQIVTQEGARPEARLVRRLRWSRLPVPRAVAPVGRAPCDRARKTGRTAFAPELGDHQPHMRDQRFGTRCAGLGRGYFITLPKDQRMRRGKIGRERHERRHAPGSATSRSAPPPSTGR